MVQGVKGVDNLSLHFIGLGFKSRKQVMAKSCTLESDTELEVYSLRKEIFVTTRLDHGIMWTVTDYLLIFCKRIVHPCHLTTVSRIFLPALLRGLAF